MFSTARGRVRASMNKYNLFNLYKKQPVKYQGLTLFQQKWKAKKETRAYHGEHLTESRWKTLFLPNLESVAQLDASLKGVEVSPTPMSLQTFAVLEKRLEFALFRSMFASSVRQAREFIRSGSVQVNGVTIRHPAFPLKSGDVFSVAPEKVLLAMGRVKPSVEQAVKVDTKQISVWNKYVNTAKQNPQVAWELKQAKPLSLNTLEKSNQESKVKTIRKFNAAVEAGMLKSQKSITRETFLNKILAIAAGKEVEELIPEQFLSLVSSNKTDLAKCLEAYKILKNANHELVGAHSLANCTKFISTKSTEFGSPKAAKEAANVKKILSEIVNQQLERVRVSAEKKKLSEDSKIPFSSKFGKNWKSIAPLDKEAILEDESKAKIELPWQKGLFGRQDPSQPFFTPWTPRPFIGAFAILPHHIEVSFETCHAIYLNDPVARPDHSEVISPFPDHVHERSYMYYVRKGL